MFENITKVRQVVYIHTYICIFNKFIIQQDCCFLPQKISENYILSDNLFESITEVRPECIRIFHKHIHTRLTFAILSKTNMYIHTYVYSTCS